VAEEYRIDVVVEPDKRGSDQQLRLLDRLEQETKQINAALKEALSMRDRGTGAALGKIEQSLVEIQRSAATSDARLRQVGRDVRSEGVRRLNRELEEAAQRASNVGSLLRRALTGLSVGLVVREFARLSDEFTRAQNLIRTVVADQSLVGETFEQLAGVANATRTELGAIVQLYQRGSIAAKELGASEAELIQFVTAVGKNLAIQGTSAEQARGALLQLSQALGATVVRAEEFNSIQEGAFSIVQAAARGIERYGGSVSKLRADVIKSRVSSQEFFDGIIRGSRESEALFARTQSTIGQSLTVLRNNLTSAVGRLNEATGASAALASSIAFLGSNLPAVAATVGTLSAIIGGQLAARALPAATASTRAFLAAWGPLGAVVAGLGALSFAIEAIGDDAREAQDTVKQLEQDLRGVATIGAIITARQREIRAIERAIEEQARRGVEASDAQRAALERLRGQIQQAAGASRELQDAGEAQAESERESAASANDRAEAVKRQSDLLNQILGPQREYAEREADLNALLEQGTITRQRYNAELAKAQQARSDADPFERQLESLVRANEELRVRATLEGEARERALAEIELREKSTGLSATERNLLREQLEERSRLRAEVEKQKDAERASESLAQLRNEVEAIRAKNTEGKIAAQVAREEAEFLRKNKDLTAEQRREAEMLFQVKLETQQADADSKRLEQLLGEVDATRQLVDEQRQLNELIRLQGGETEATRQRQQELNMRYLEGQQSLEAGFDRVRIKLRQEAEDLSLVSEAITTTFVDHAANAIATFAREGELDIKEFAQSVLAELQQILIRALLVQAVSAALGVPTAGSGSLSGLIPGRARGGTTQPGQGPVVVGEHGPEVFMPGRTGAVIPNAATAAPSVPQQNTTQVVVVQSMDQVPQAIAGGGADEQIIVRLGANKDRVLQTLGLAG